MDCFSKLKQNKTKQNCRKREPKQKRGIDQQRWCLYNIKQIKQS